MTGREQAEEMVVREFSVLHERHGYGAPLVTREGWFTSVDFAKGNIGIELGLDWRDVGLYVLAVRLHNGQLPEGYYVEAGRPCRKHIVNVARQRKWPNAPPVPRRVRPHRVSSPKELVESARTTRDQLMGWLDRLEGEWLEIWQYTVDRTESDQGPDREGPRRAPTESNRRGTLGRGATGTANRTALSSVGTVNLGVARLVAFAIG